MADPPLVIEYGEAALLVVLGDHVDPGVNGRVHRTAARLIAETGADARFGRPVPAYASLLVPFDPERIEASAARRAVEAVLADPAVAEPGPEARDGADGGRVPIEIPVRYGGSDGPDLDEVAARLRRSADEVVALHTAPVYRVFMIGFSPGFPYLGPLPADLELPRRAEPRSRVPAGSVAIAGRQTGIYPSESPGGWHLIGRTGEWLWDPAADPPNRLDPGDLVRFVAI
jgi:KipI family sensor histidine kinase inhibitor